MGAIYKMRLRRIRPVGESVPRPREYAVLPDWANGYKDWFVGSGTEALALALLALKVSKYKEGGKVIIPAYCCPDIVTAIHFAGFAPLVVDVGENTPFIDYEQLSVAKKDGIAAVISSHFMGIRDHTDFVRSKFAGTGIAIIEDSAQYLPGGKGKGPSADFAVYSFGRGKPCPALGGGMLLAKGESVEFVLQAGKVIIKDNSRFQAAALEIKRWAYNTSLHELPFGLLSRIPFFRVGEVQQKQVDNIRCLAEAHRSLSLSALSRWNETPCLCQSIFYEELGAMPEITLLHGRPAYRNRLLRFPILLESKEVRDQLLLHLCKSGIGASPMYKKPIDEIVPEIKDRNRNHVNAIEFSGRILMLPNHSGLTKAAAFDLVFDIKRFFARRNQRL